MIRRRHDFSPREVQVLSLVAEGMTNMQIAERLWITEDTVKTHLARSYAKLGTSSRVTAVLLAVQAGLLPCPCGKGDPVVVQERRARPDKANKLPNVPRRPSVVKAKKIRLPAVPNVPKRPSRART